MRHVIETHNLKAKKTKQTKQNAKIPTVHKKRYTEDTHIKHCLHHPLTKFENNLV